MSAKNFLTTVLFCTKIMVKQINNILNKESDQI